MVRIEITEGMVDGYLAAVANALESAGIKLPSALPYTLIDDENFSVYFTLLEALTGGELDVDGTDLMLVWHLVGGWHAGHPRGGGVDVPTTLGIGVAPLPPVVVGVVAGIRLDGLVRAEYPIAGDYPAALLTNYAPEGAPQ